MNDSVELEIGQHSIAYLEATSHYTEYAASVVVFCYVGDDRARNFRRKEKI